MSAHTPGPWSARAVPMRDGSVVVHSSAVAVATAHAADEPGETDGETRANASLIAAAPDLLAACEAVVKFADIRTRSALPLPPNLSEAVEKARAAIAKVGGAK